MAMEAQGVYIRRASTDTVSATASTNFDIGTSMIQCSSGVTFTTAGSSFTTNMLVGITATALSSGCTWYYPIKSVTATAIFIYGTFPSTGTTSLTVTGYDMGLIGEITDFTGPGGAAAVIDITHLQSTAKEKMIGLRDEGQLSMTLNLNATDSGQDGLKEDRAQRTRNLYDMILTDTTWDSSKMPSRASWWGYCLQYSAAGAVDDKLVANAVVEIDGPVVYTTRITT